MISSKLDTLTSVLAAMAPRVIACSGGIDSLLLATVSHRQNPRATRVAHAMSLAVQHEGTARVRERAFIEGWQLDVVDSGEFEDENYLQNPANRCYYCKTHLYSRLKSLAIKVSVETPSAILLSGANVDDLGEYRPGLIAAAEAGVRHPYIEAGIGKADIRELARQYDLPFADLPASPCLSSRLYTGTRVTASRLRAVEAGEKLVRQIAHISVVRCRLRESEVLIEVDNADRDKVTASLIEAVGSAMRAEEETIGRVMLDPKPYRAGRSFVLAQE